jgi:molybdate transport system ATP-binding protein
MRAIQPSENSGPHLSVRIVCQLSKAFSVDAEFDAPAGFTMLLGPSGGGKTTLLNCIAGLVRPDAGRIAIGERVLFDSAKGIDVPVRGRRLGYLFQNLALFPHLTIEENVMYGISKLSTEQRRERIRMLTDAFSISHLLPRKPSEISGGERQRAALARSLVTNPSLLLLDEPLVALDNDTKSRILDDLRDWNTEHNIPILYVTHAQQEAFALGEHVVVIEAGRILAQGLPEEVLSAPRHETVAQIAGFENVFDATVKSFKNADGTMLCQLEGGATELEVPLGHAEIGSKVRIAMHAGDIMLASDRFPGLSARNMLRGKVVSVRNEGVTIIANVFAGAEFEVHLTPSARNEVRVEPGREVWLVIKTYSCHLMETS